MIVNNKKKGIRELNSEIDRLKSELDKTYNSLKEMVSELAVKFEEVMQDNQPVLMESDRPESKREDLFKATLEMAKEASHELAQPLTILIGRCELLNMLVGKNPEIAKHIDSILSSANRVGEIVRKIQSINKKILAQCAETSSIKK